MPTSVEAADFASRLVADRTQLAQELLEIVENSQRLGAAVGRLRLEPAETDEQSVGHQRTAEIRASNIDLAVVTICAALE